jgi:hypothetical protein
VEQGLVVEVGAVHPLQEAVGVPVLLLLLCAVAVVVALLLVATNHPQTNPLLAAAFGQQGLLLLLLPPSRHLTSPQMCQHHLGVLVLMTSPSLPVHPLLLLVVARAALRQVVVAGLAVLLPAGVQDPHLLLLVLCVSCSVQQPQGRIHVISSDRVQGWASKPGTGGLDRMLT